MASFQIHEDQENRGLENRQKLINPPQQKRSVLGVLDNKPERVTRAKQPLGGKSKPVEVKTYKKPFAKLPPPVVPVAQFEAFKVYEDSNEAIEKEQRERLRKRKDKDQFSNIYKGTAEDRFITKKEAKELVAKQKQESLPTNLDTSNSSLDTTLAELENGLGSPMSIEKSFKENQSNVIAEVAKSKTLKDIFFDLDEYRQDIFWYLCQKEKLNRPKPGYMRKQPDITPNMRTILVDWLVEVAEEYKLNSETLYLAVNYIDRFLSYMSVVRAKLQLVGTAAMFIASKYEEIYPPDVGEFVYITDDTYDRHQVIRMEILILKILDFDLSIPTPYAFISAICISNKLSEELMYLAMYMSELALLETEPSLEILPSVMACSAIAVASHTLGLNPWSPELAKNTGYELIHLKETIVFLSSMFSKAPTLPQQAIQEKYKSNKYLHVASLKSRKVDIKFD